VVLATLALAAAPGSALAQSGAGDEQYQDPFSGQTSGGGSQGSGGSLSQGPPSAAPATAAPATAAHGALPGELARTGTDLRIELAAGIALLIGGLALRRRADGR
jgi:hypothetical protein